MDPIIGIDLGTTNSEAAYVFKGKVEVICDSDNGIMPSCVGMSNKGQVIVGIEASNQAAAAPDRTVLSIKRSMGTDRKINLDSQQFSPPEISAFILKALKLRAEKQIGQTVKKAVITVPAYFTDAQRQATREAGEIAGLEVVRIINEPTAAALAYESNNPDTQRILIFDLGGGTFDVSIVKIEEGVVEVLSSTGDNHLGGDDFDQKIMDHLTAHIEKKHQLSVRENHMVMARLRKASEAAKIELSSAPYALIEEDHIGKKALRDIHLSYELSRTAFEEMIDADLARTMESVSKALKDAAMLPPAIDKIILVGGSTKISKVSKMLEEKFSKQPHGEIDPDLCVAMGAGIQAAREMGVDQSVVLVDITPYTFGTSSVGEVEGVPSMTQFVPLIRRNTKIPARKTEIFFTLVDQQKAVDVRIFQGEAPDAEDNLLLGNYLFQLTPAPAGSEISLHFDLDLNGILKIKAVEKKTDKQIDAVIENAIPKFTKEELSKTRSRIDGIWDKGRDSAPDESSHIDQESKAPTIPADIAAVINQAEEKLDNASEDDREEMINLIEDIRDAVREGQLEDAHKYCNDLDDILFYMG